jgi:hypothetical protein
MFGFFSYFRLVFERALTYFEVICDSGHYTPINTKFTRPTDKPKVCFKQKSVLLSCPTPFHRGAVLLHGNKRWCKSCRSSYFKYTRKEKGVINEIKETKEDTYIGYTISLKNSEKTISLMIYNLPICCESWDWWYEVDFSGVVNGSKLYHVQIEPDIVCGGQNTMVIRLITNRGCIRLKVMCENGAYYPHLVKYDMLDKTDSQVL